MWGLNLGGKKEGGLLKGLFDWLDSDELLILVLILVLLMDGDEDSWILIAALALILIV